MNIHENIEIVDLALKYKDCLILGDLQLGYEEYLSRGGVVVPRFQTEDVLERIRHILDEARDVKKVIFNGDIKHHFGKITPQEWDAVGRLMEELIGKYKVVIVKGNHDVMLGPILKKYGNRIEFLDSYELEDVLITHGDKIKISNKKLIIIGHEHPAISFDEKPGEKYKCFLKGKYGKSDLIVMPSFSTLTVGTDIRFGKFLSPYLSKDLNKFEIYVIEDKAYYFGKIRDLPN